MYSAPNPHTTFSYPSCGVEVDEFVAFFKHEGHVSKPKELPATVRAKREIMRKSFEGVRSAWSFKRGDGPGLHEDDRDEAEKLRDLFVDKAH